MSNEAGQLYEFGPFRLDVAERLLLRDGQPVPVTPKAFDTLLALVANSGHVLEKDVLMERVWPDAIVEESTLAQNVFTLRKALGEGEYIETVPKHGYRFVASVKEVGGGGAELVIERHTRSRLVTREEVDDGQGPAGSDGGGLPEGPVGAAGENMLRRPRQAFWAAPAMLLLGAAAILAFVFFFRSKTREAGTAMDVRVVAVLPFAPISQEGREEYLELGMADALITKLSRLKRIIVRPTSSVRKYTGADPDPVAAGRELRVDSVLEGSVQKLGDRIRVTARLVRVEDGRALWSGEFDERSADIFTVQDRISEQMTQALALTLTGEERKLLAKRYTSNPEAYQLYEKGRYFWNKRTEEGLTKAVDCFQEAIDLDPKYALAYAGLADCSISLSNYGVRSARETYPKAKAAALSALEQDEQLAEAHTSLAHFTWLYDWDWARAEHEFARAIELNPNYATSHQWYSVFLSAMARHQEAIAEAKQAQALDPVSAIITMDVARAFFFARQYDEAVTQCLKAIELEPRYAGMEIWLVGAYEKKGMYDQAVDAHLRGRTVAGVNPEWISALRSAYAESGWHGYWQKELDRVHDIARARYVMPYNLAYVYARLGDKDQAFTWLWKAYEEHSDQIVVLKVDPVLDNLRPDPRFQDLLRRVGLTRNNEGG